MHSVEAEMSVLGGMFIDPEAIAKAVEELEESMFFADANRRIYRGILKLWERGEAVDEVTLLAHLRECGDLESAGGVGYLSSLMESTPTAANIEYHIGIVRRLHTRRRLAEVGGAIVTAARTADTAVEDLVDEAGREIFKIAQDGDTRGFVGLGSLLWPEMARIESAGQSGSDITGVPSGFPDLDRMTAGFQRGDLIIVAARPSMGKTAFVLNIAQHVAIAAKRAIAFFSLEMSKEALAQRLLSSEARVDSTRVRTGQLRDDDYPRLAQAAGLLNTAPIYIDDTPAVTVMQMRARARRLKSECEKSGAPLAAIAVDYLQLAHGQGENRTQVVSEISRGLKALAKELDVPVIALSQLSRAVESRPDKRPMMSDLRESGALEQDADLIMFLYRPEYYHGPVDKDGNSLEGRAELVIGKQRTGATGTVHLMFHKEYTRFESYSNREPR